MHFPFSEIMKCAAGGTSVFRPGAFTAAGPKPQTRTKVPLGRGMTADVASDAAKHFEDASKIKMEQSPHSNVFNISKAGELLPFTAIMKLAARR